MDSFRLWLRREIENRNMTQRAFAARCGMAPETINRILNDRYTLRLSGRIIVRIATGLGVTREMIESHMSSQPTAA